MRGDIIIDIPVSFVHGPELLTRLGCKQTYEPDQLDLLLRFARTVVETMHMHALHGPLIHCQLAYNLLNVRGGT